MTYSFGTNYAGTKEWLAATKDMQLSADGPPVAHSNRVSTRLDSSRQDKFEKDPRKASRPASSRSGVKMR